MNTTRVERFLQAMLFCAALAGGASQAQTFTDALSGLYLSLH